MRTNVMIPTSFALRESGGGEDYVQTPNSMLPGTNRPTGRSLGNSVVATMGPGNGSAAPSNCSNADGAAPTSNPASDHPVVLATGAKLLDQQDFVHASALGMPLQRAYHSDNPYGGMFGRGWSSSLDPRGEVGVVNCTGAGCTPATFKLWMPESL